MARKRFGQHFLHEQGVIDHIIDAIRPAADDAMVEIGPGQGALTQPLLMHVGKLAVIEIDRDLIARLRIDQPPNLTVIEADAMTIDYAELADLVGTPMRLVGNLPYNISSPLLFTLLSSQARIRDMHFMLQKEVVDRMVAEPGSKAYGRLSVAIAARARATALFDVGPGAFTPPPEVMSSVVRLVPGDPGFTIHNPIVFDRIVTDAFSKRRKTLRNALSQWLTADELAAIDIDPTLRPERISPAEFARIANAVSHHA